MLNEIYRSCTDYREILRIFQKSSALSDHLLWQSENGEKNILRPQHIEIDFVTRGVVVHFDPFQGEIKTHLPIFVKLEYRNTVFKVTHYEVKFQTLHFTFPEMMKTRELRSIDRVTLNSEKENTITLRPTLNGFNTDGSEVNFRLVDLTPEGVGMIISETNRTFLKNNRLLWLSQINDKKLYEPILAEVVYMSADLDTRQSSKRRMKELKVGLKLSSQLPHDVYTKIVQ